MSTHNTNISFRYKKTIFLLPTLVWSYDLGEASPVFTHKICFGANLRFVMFSLLVISDPNSRTYESLQYNLNNIQRQLADFISNEEDALETRIR